MRCPICNVENGDNAKFCEADALRALGDARVARAALERGTLGSRAIGSRRLLWRFLASLATVAVS